MMNNLQTKKQQHGAVLIVSLLILLILTVLGLSAVRTSTMEEFMARNTRDYKIAFEAADSALSDGAGWALGLANEPGECATAPCEDANKAYKKGVLEGLGFTDEGESWWVGSNTKEFLTADTKDIPEAATDPRFVVDVQFIPDSLRHGGGVPTGKHVFKVTSRGTGSTDAAEVMVQQTVVKRF